MQHIPCDVSTISVGLCASFGTVLLTAGTKGKRFALPNSTVHMHQPISGAQGQASDIEIAAKEVLRVKDSLTKIISNHTGQSEAKIIKDSDRDSWMTAKQAVTYGLIDEILKKPADSDKNSSEK
jgi:ATP-dependent Clp protease protease subunit